MTHRWFLVATALGIVTAGFFLVRSLSGDLVYYLTTSEAVASRTDFPDGRSFKLAGLVVPGSIEELGGGESTFRITDGATTVDILLTRTPPPLFDDDVPVLLSGSWDDGTYVATDALIRHDEDYEAPAEGNYEDAEASASGSG